MINKLRTQIFYGSFFRYIRLFLKYVLAALYYIVKVFSKNPKVADAEETIQFILTNKCSISRFGDGEFTYIADKLDLPFQKQNELLRNKMVEILKSGNDKLLVGLPACFFPMTNLNKKSRLFWQSYYTMTYFRIRKYLDLNKLYYNASITRPYIGYRDKQISEKYFSMLMRIWEGRKVLLVEGEKSRLGVGNNLFALATSVERILAPMHHAFDKYDELVSEIIKHDKTKLILIALGPTATVMAADLADLGYQALDIGNIDIEYEWYLRGAQSKIKIPGKYTSEARNGRQVEDVVNELYSSQIISKVL